MKIHKLMTNLEVAELLDNVAASYKLKDENKYRFQIIAYERASDAIQHLSSEVKDVWDDGKLDEIPGVGKSISEHLDEIFKTGKSMHFDSLMKDIPPSTFEMMKIPGVGAKSAYKLSQELGITKEDNALEKLDEAAKKGKIESLEGFGKDSQDQIIKAIEEVKGKGEKRMTLPYAAQIGEEVIEWLKKDKNVVKADTLGSLRRKASTVGDIDISVSSRNPSDTLEHFVKYPNSKRTIEKGDTSATILLPGEHHVDVMVVKPESYGSLLQHFTGSKHHNIALREHALKMGLSLSEHGIKDKKKDSIKMFETEESFYKYLKLEYIPPEIREDTGEIEASIKGKLPDLIELNDVKSDLQIHSDYDIETSHDIGASSMRDIVKKAESLGYEYIAFTEHNPSKSKHTAEDIYKILEGKKVEIDKLNNSLKERNLKHVYNSLEIDILPDGNLPIDEKSLELLDFALVSIHSSFRQDRKKMTERVIRALNHPQVKIFAHPTGRKLGEREGVELDWTKIFDFCAKNDKWIEINTNPDRLDLPDHLVKDAINAGIKLTLGTDAHHIDHMDYMEWGVSVARRGWATKNDVINTLPYKEFDKLLK
jgi:DNA polymerase (family 10)